MSTMSLQDYLDRHDSTVEALRMAEGNRLTLGSDSGGFYPKHEFSNWIEEQIAPKETSYIADFSLMPNLHVKGPDALQLFSDHAINSFSEFEPGKFKHAVFCNYHGEVITEGVVLRLGVDEFDIQGVYNWLKFNFEKEAYDAHAESRDRFIYQIQGPEAVNIMKEVTNHPIEEISFLSFQKISINGREVNALPHGMAGERGFEIHGKKEHGGEIWDLIVEEGQKFGIREQGFRTQLMNHLENCFPTTGFHYLPAIYRENLEDYRNWLDAGDFEANFSIEGSYDGATISDWYSTPSDLGWGHYVDFGNDFVGAEALKEKDQSKHEIVTLVWNPEDVTEVFQSLFEAELPHKFMDMPTKQRRTVQADTVSKDGREIGVSKGRGFVYPARDMISLCTIDSDYSNPGNEVIIHWGEGDAQEIPSVETHRPKEIRAVVADAPYKKDKRKS